MRTQEQIAQAAAKRGVSFMVVKRDHWLLGEFFEVCTCARNDGFLASSWFGEPYRPGGRAVCTVTASSYTKAQHDIATRLFCNCSNLHACEWTGAE